jgi:hypothetical protein
VGWVEELISLVTFSTLSASIGDTTTRLANV